MKLDHGGIGDGSQAGLGCQNEAGSGLRGKRKLIQILHGGRVRPHRECLIHAHSIWTGWKKLYVLGAEKEFRQYDKKVKPILPVRRAG